MLLSTKRKQLSLSIVIQRKAIVAAFRVLALQLQHSPELQTLDVRPVLVLTDIGSIKCHLISISPEEMNKWKIRMTRINDCIEEIAHIEAGHRSWDGVAD